MNNEKDEATISRMRRLQRNKYEEKVRHSVLDLLSLKCLSHTWRKKGRQGEVFEKTAGQMGLEWRAGSVGWR